MKRLLALILCAALLLSGCGAKNAMGFSTIVKFRDMDYTRPDMDAIEKTAQAAMNTKASWTTADQLLEAVWDFYDCYDDFMTAYDLAYVHYHANLSDLYWQEEYTFCAENAPQLEVYLEDIYRALAASPHREQLEEEAFGEGWFDAYDGESWYDDTVVALLEQEQTLIAEYLDLTAQGQDLDLEEFYDEYTTPMLELLGELVRLRQELADHTGYSSYTDFAWDFYYYRDYTPAQAAEYLAEIREQLTPVYRSMQEQDPFAPENEACSEGEVFRYVETAAKEMGGVVWDAFRLMDQGELYDISPSEYKSGLSFELYFSEYCEPYIMISGTGTRYDCLTFAHEFGHFATDYAAAGSLAGIDVMEVFSQAMELLSLRHAGADEAFTAMKLADCLCTYSEQAAYAAFEQELYTLTGDQLTPEKLLARYEDICNSYGCDAMDWDPRDLITVAHFYSNPLYVISYVVSNDAALQLYQLELQTPGAGTEVFLDSLDTEESFFLAFLEEAGLRSPFERTAEVKAFMEERFGGAPQEADPGES